MRKPWKKLIIKFVDTFFSKPILCKMDESIDDLEGHKRTPDAMGKDIFKVMKAEREEAEAEKNEKKEADKNKKEADEKEADEKEAEAKKK